MKLSRLFAILFGLMSLTISLSCGGGGGGGGGGGSSTNVSPQNNSGVPCIADFFPNLTFDQPVGLLQHPQDPNRWYVVEQTGVVRTVSGTAASVSENFIDIVDRVKSGGEAGLLGMAFHPDFSQNHLVYLSYTGPGDPLVSYISAFVADTNGLTADPASEQRLLTVSQPFSNHNGGWIAFGPDGFLYIGFGDGGGIGDPEGNAQNIHTLLGSILRIDVNRPDAVRGTLYGIPADNPFAASHDCSAAGGCPEIFAYGFRNPWRGSFDTATGALWVGDVGQNKWEEIDRVGAGLNYGWPILEGNHCYGAETCNSTGLTPPVAEYGHSEGISVIAGYVYRGSALPELSGDFIFGDFGTGQIWYILDAAQGGTQVAPLISSGLSISSFGQDAAGELYIINHGNGHIYQLTRCAATGT